MKLEINTNGSWRTVLVGLHEESLAAASQFSTALSAAGALAEISAADPARKPLKWRLVSDDGALVAILEGDAGWRGRHPGGFTA